MGAAMTGMACHGGILPVGGHLLHLQRLHAPGGPPGRHVAGPCHLLVDPRLDRARRGRPHPRAHRAPGVAAGHAGPGGGPAGRRQRVRAGLAVRGRRRRADRDDPQPPVDPGAGRDGRTGRRRTAPRRLRAADRGRPPRLVLVGTGSEVHLCLGAAEALGSARAARCGWCRCRAGSGSRTRTTTTAPRCCRPACRPSRSRRPRRSAGTATPTPAWPSTPSARRAPSQAVLDHFGFTVDHVVERARELLSTTKQESTP